MTSTPGLKHLVLLGLGHAHVQVLHGLAQSRPADLNLTVIAPRSQAVYSGMVPGFVAGHYTAEQCRIPLDALLARSGARHIAGSAIGIDADTRTVSLASGEAVAWDWLSLNTGPVMDRDLLEARMPGARRHALFVRPIDAFVQLWPQVAEMAAWRARHADWFARFPSLGEWRDLQGKAMTTEAWENPATAGFGHVSSDPARPYVFTVDRSARKVILSHAD
jgi:NADH dehydrogenase FAD-containing subunit